jgi:hypothetical protein
LAGKNVTVKSVRKAQKVKGLKNPRKLEVQVKRESFFNFFSPPIPTTDDQSEEQVPAVTFAAYSYIYFMLIGHHFILIITIKEEAFVHDCICQIARK